MASRARMHPIDWRRATGALLGLLALACAISAFVYALSEPAKLWPWLTVSGCIYLSGVGAHLARRRR